MISGAECLDISLAVSAAKSSFFEMYWQRPSSFGDVESRELPTMHAIHSPSICRFKNIQGYGLVSSWLQKSVTMIFRRFSCRLVLSSSVYRSLLLLLNRIIIHGTQMHPIETKHSISIKPKTHRTTTGTAQWLLSCLTVSSERKAAECQHFECDEQDETEWN